VATIDSETVLDVPVQDQGDSAETQKPKQSQWLVTRRMKMFLAIAGVSILVGSLMAWRYYAARETTDNAQVDGYITVVSARVSGTAQQVNFNNDDVVEKDQVLVQLDPADYQVALERARAELAEAQRNAVAARTTVPLTSTTANSGVTTAMAGVASAERQASAAHARVREAQAEHTRAAQDLERMKALIAQDEISHQQYDASVAAEQSSRATLDAALAEASAAESQVAQARSQLNAVETAPEQIAISRSRAGSAEALVAQKEAAVKRAELDLQYTTVKAPSRGIAGQRNVQVGQVGQAGVPLLALVNMDDLWCTANFKETQLANMRVGQKAQLHVDALQRTFPGHVSSIGGATGARFSLLPPENATGNYVKVVQRVPVKIVFDKDPELQRIRSGMSIVVTVLTK
jgi:membrane fusion protein (multidrug efflux system)